MSSFTHERSRVANLSRTRAADDPELVEARGRMLTERLTDHIEKRVAQWPPLTPAQLDRIALLLRGGESA